jgi:hypothetical protein
MVRPTVAIVTLVATIGLASCTTGESTDPEGSPRTTATTSSNLGGEAAPIQKDGESYPHPGGAISGLVELQPDGCWTIDAGDGPQVAIFPVGYEMTYSNEWMLGPAGSADISSGTTINGIGGPAEVGSLPGGSTGFWASYLSFCDPSASHVIILDDVTVTPAADTVTDEQLMAVWDAAELTESWPCGLGFTIASADQTVAVYLNPLDASLPTTAPVTFPSERWEGNVVIGKDLLVNHCDDVVEPDEPQRIVDATWPLIAGTLDFVAPTLDGICSGGGDVQATLTHAVVDASSGPVDIGDLVIVNSAYGCFAG